MIEQFFGSELEGQWGTEDFGGIGEGVWRIGEEFGEGVGELEVLGIEASGMELVERLIGGFGGRGKRMEVDLAGYGLGIGGGVLDFMDGYHWVLDFFLDDEGEGILILEDFEEVMDMDFEGLELSFLEEEGGFSKGEEGIGEEG